MSKPFDKYIKRLKSVDKVIISLSKPIIKGIVKRTQSGKDVNGKAFKPYSKSGRGGKGIVDLTISGDMLGSINGQKVKGGVKIYFPSSKERKKAHANQKTRYFFGIDKDQKEIIRKQIIKSILGTRG